MRQSNSTIPAISAKQRARKPESKFRIPIILALIFALSMALRVALTYNLIFPSEGIVIFQGNDAWMHMRLAENMAHNFPIPMFYDHYTWFPHGSDIIIPPMMSWLIVGSGYVVSLGQPSIHTLQVVGAWLPPILGSLCIIPIYFIGREMHDKWTGILAAILVATLPTAFLNRSLLGFTDHHVLEVLLATTTMMFLMLGYRRKRFLYYILAGVSLGLFQLCWQGAIFFLFILWLWFVVQFLIDHWHGEDTHLLSRGVGSAFGVAALLYIFTWASWSALPTVYIVAPLLAVATPNALRILAMYIKSKRRLAFTLGGLGAAILTGTYLLSPSTLGLFEYAFAVARFRTISETMPLIPQAAFQQYGVNLVFFFGGLFMAMRHRQKPLLIVVWCLVIFIAVSTQCRWDYYFAVAIGLMSAYFFTTLGMYFIKEVRQGISLGLCVALLFCTVPISIHVARTPTLISQDWYMALNILRENTPEPFGDPDAYYEVELDQEPDYGVLSWWDYGHWITQISHRVPVANPFQQGAVEAAEFFVDGEDIEGVKYIIIDQAMLTNKYYAMVAWLGRDAYGIAQAPEDSAISRLSRGELEGWQLVFRQNTVSVFERRKE